MFCGECGRSVASTTPISQPAAASRAPQPVALVEPRRDAAAAVARERVLDGDPEPDQPVEDASVAGAGPIEPESDTEPEHVAEVAAAAEGAPEPVPLTEPGASAEPIPLTEPIAVPRQTF